MDDEYLVPPDGGKLDYPCDIHINDVPHLRLYIKHKYGREVRNKYLPIWDNAKLVQYLTDKGYTFGAKSVDNEAITDATSNGN